MLAALRRRLRRPGVLGIAALTTASALVLGGCASNASSGGDSSDETGTSTVLPTPSTTIDVPEDTNITAPGTALTFGDTATVAYELKSAGTVLNLSVLTAKKGSLDDFAGFNLEDRYQRQANYYYVRVTVKNVGTKAFGGADVPLWGVSGNNTLLPPVKFTSAFAPCPTESLPAKFKPGDRFETCLVFLSPDKGRLAGVSYRPTEDYVPIEWTGDVSPQRGKGTRGGKSGKGAGRGKKGDKSRQ